MNDFKVTLTETEQVTIFEYYGKQFPIHTEAWEKHQSFWQEDYTRFLLQKDIGLLTIYYGRPAESILWEGHFHSLHDIYTHLTTRDNPFFGFIYGGCLFEHAYKEKDGIVQNIYLEELKDIFIVAYLHLFSTQQND